MATLDRQIPSPDTFLCKPWSTFVSAAELHTINDGPVEHAKNDLSNYRDSVKLSREEMHVYGQFPTQEDFCLVVCHVCNQVVKPQGILMHYKKRHGSPCPSRTPLVPTKPKMSAVASSTGDTLTFRVPRDYPHGRFSKAPLAVYPPKGARGKTCVSLPVVSLEKMPCLGRAEVGGTNGSTSFSTPSSSSSSSPSPAKPSLTPASSHRSGERMANGRGPATPHSTASPSSTLDSRPSPGRSPLDRLSSPTPSPSVLDRKPSPSPSPRPSAPPSPLDRKPQNGARISKPQRRLSGRVFDPNKHCGVVDPESKRACTRSLTCKTHSLTHRRAVPGRTKSFDILLAEHKSQAKEREGDGGQIRKDGASLTTLLQDTTTPKKPHSLNGRPISMLKLRLANAHISRVAGGVGGNGAALLSSTPVVAPVSAPSSAATPEPASSWVRVGAESRLSSDEGDAKSPEDFDKQTAYRYSSCHPRPLAHCAFNSRLMGRGHYVFDRRWDRMRLALHCMVEKHVNAHIWRKVPLAADKLPSLSSTGTLQSPLSSPSSLSPQPVSSLSFPSSSEGFSLVSYTAAFPLSAAGAGMFSIREPPQPLAPVSVGKPRNGTAKPGNFLREDSEAGAIKRKASSFSSSGSPRRNGGSYHPDNLFQRLGTPGGKALGRGGSRLGSRTEDLYSSLEPSSTNPYSHSRDFNPLPPAPSSPLAYGGGAEGRKRRSPSSYGGNASKMTKAAGLESIFRRSNGTGLLAAGPQSPRQPRLNP